MSGDTRPVVVAGIDGSPESLSAAHWAAAEAVRRRVSVQLQHSAYLPVTGRPAYGYPAEFIEYAGIHGHRLLENAAAEISSAYPDLEITTLLTSNDPRQALVEASDGVTMTVVGCLGTGRLRKVMLGSVSLHLAAHGRSPVAVVPFHREHRAGPVLVGADGSAQSEPAVEFAFGEAEIRGVGVVAAIAHDNWGHQGVTGRPNTFDMAEAREENALLSKQLARFAKQYPQVPIHEHCFSGQPADCLLGHAQHSPPAERPQLIVVGSRGRGVLSGLFLGSTSHSVIAHAACPVVVVRPISI